MSGLSALIHLSTGQHADEYGTIRVIGTCTKASLVTPLKEETHSVSRRLEDRSSGRRNACHMQLLRQERGHIRYKKQLLKDVPAGTEIIYLCCD